MSDIVEDPTTSAGRKRLIGFLCELGRHRGKLKQLSSHYELAEFWIDIGDGGDRLILRQIAKPLVGLFQ
ncbi:hypothetical protein [Mesorhizobium sp. M0907]